MKPLLPSVLAAAALLLPGSAALADGSIAGTVKFTGEAPKLKPLRNEGDPFCARTKANDESVLVNGGGLANVIVRISKGVAKAYPPPAEPAVVDQSTCLYRPRVQGVVAGQKLVIKNSDNVMHNVHTYLGTETVFNKAMPNDKVPPLESAAEIRSGDAAILRFQCDVHPWMRAYVSITKHPFFAVSGEKDGGYSIKGVPPGKYSLEAVHEKCGTKTQDIEVKDGAPTSVDFTFDAEDCKKAPGKK